MLLITLPNRGGQPPHPSMHANMVLDEAHSQYCSIMYQTVEPIKAGSEIYTSYGDDDWFESRYIKMAPTLPVNEIPLPEMQNGDAMCMSHLLIRDSDIPMAGKGVFSVVPYEEGETVYISPALVLPKQHLRKHEDTNVLINYCISEDGSDAAILPIGLTGMLNHGGKKSNVRMVWHTNTSVGDESLLEKPVQDLEALPYAPLDIRYVATRPIEVGEELVINYGDEWHRKWTVHLENLIEWNEKYGDQSRKTLKPQFREPIGAPHGFFPHNFKSECIGKAFCNESPSFKRRKAFAALEKKRKLKARYEASQESMMKMNSASDSAEL